MNEPQRKPQEHYDNLASELLSELKRIIKRQWLLIVALIALLAATNIYHIYQWSQFDTVVVDSQDGGNANYIGQDGDVYNYGEGDSTAEEENQQNEEQGNTN